MGRGQVFGQFYGGSFGIDLDRDLVHEPAHELDPVATGRRLGQIDGLPSVRPPACGEVTDREERRFRLDGPGDLGVVVAGFGVALSVLEGIGARLGNRYETLEDERWIRADTVEVVPNLTAQMTQGASVRKRKVVVILSALYDARLLQIDGVPSTTHRKPTFRMTGCQLP